MMWRMPAAADFWLEGVDGDHDVCMTALRLHSSRSRSILSFPKADIAYGRIES